MNTTEPEFRAAATGTEKGLRGSLAVRHLPAEKGQITGTVRPAHPRNLGLDVLRCCAIMLVLLDHGSYLFYDYVPEAIGNNLLLAGHWGVQIFFVLSGFLIGRILIKEMMTRVFNPAAIFNFWKRRWFRTLPNYLLFIALFAVISLTVPEGALRASFWKEAFAMDDVRQLAYYPFCLQNFVTTDLSFMGHSWSLAVEEWFYLILPSAIFPFIYFNKKGSLKAKMIRCFGAMAALFLLIRTCAILGVWPGFTKLSVIYNLDNLMYGVILAWLFTYYKSEVLRRKNLLLACSGVLFLGAWALQNRFILTGSPQHAWEALVIPVQAIAFACALPWFYDIRATRRTWRTRLVTAISEASYSVYLVHFIVLVFFIDTIGQRLRVESAIGAMMLFLLFLASTIWISSLNYRLFEKPVTALRERFSHS